MCSSPSPKAGSIPQWYSQYSSSKFAYHVSRKGKCVESATSQCLPALYRGRMHRRPTLRSRYTHSGYRWAPLRETCWTVETRNNLYLCIWQNKIDWNIVWPLYRRNVWCRLTCRFRMRNLLRFGGCNIYCMLESKKSRRKSEINMCSTIVRRRHDLNSLR